MVSRSCAKKLPISRPNLVNLVGRERGRKVKEGDSDSIHTRTVLLQRVRGKGEVAAS